MNLIIPPKYKNNIGGGLVLCMGPKMGVDQCWHGIETICKVVFQKTTKYWYMLDFCNLALKCFIAGIGEVYTTIIPTGKKNTECQTFAHCRAYFHHSIRREISLVTLQIFLQRFVHLFHHKDWAWASLALVGTNVLYNVGMIQPLQLFAFSLEILQWYTIGAQQNFMKLLHSYRLLVQCC